MKHNQNKIELLYIHFPKNPPLKKVAFNVNQPPQTCFESNIQSIVTKQSGSLKFNEFAHSNQ